MAQCFASGIPATNGVAQPATCDTNTLETSTGPVQLRAEFTPEVINLRWYNDDIRINVPTTSNTCTYGTAINLPTNPTKPGYKFAGWEVIPEYDFSTLNTNANGNDRYGKGESGGSDVCRYNENNVTCDSSFSDLARYQWKILFNVGTISNSGGTIYGNAMCSTTSGTYATSGIPTSDGGQHCWCMATGYKPNDSDVRYSPTSNLSWIFNTTYDSTSSCAGRCAYNCAGYIRSLADFRIAVFGVGQ